MCSTTLNSMIKLLKVVDGIEYYQIGEQGLEKIMEIEEKYFPPELRASKQIMRERIRFFPEGTFLATKNGEPMGYFINLLVDDSFVENLEMHLTHSPILPVPLQKGTNLWHASIGITSKAHHISRELILCTEDIIKKHKVTRQVAVLETDDGDKLTRKIGFRTIKTVETTAGTAKIKVRSPEGFFELVRKAL